MSEHMHVQRGSLERTSTASLLKIKYMYISTITSILTSSPVQAHVIVRLCTHSTGKKDTQKIMKVSLKTLSSTMWLARSVFWQRGAAVELNGTVLQSKKP
jgi:hypothetical protein